jgi:hypothetical protein
MNTHLPSHRTSLEQRINTLCTTLRTVTQPKMTTLRQHLRNTLHQHCTIHTPSPPQFLCHTTHDNCTCLANTTQTPPTIDLTAPPDPHPHSPTKATLTTAQPPTPTHPLPTPTTPPPDAPPICIDLTPPKHPLPSSLPHTQTATALPPPLHL